MSGHVFCPQCGTRNESDAAFCESCGQQVAAAMPSGSGAPAAKATGTFPLTWLIVGAIVLAAGAGYAFQGPLSEFVRSLSGSDATSAAASASPGASATPPVGQTASNASATVGAPDAANATMGSQVVTNAPQLQPAQGAPVPIIESQVPVTRSQNPTPSGAGSSSMPVGSDPRQEALVQATLSAQADATRNALEQAFKAEQIASQRQVTARAASEPATERGAGQPVERTLPASGQVVRETPTPTPTPSPAAPRPAPETAVAPASGAAVSVEIAAGTEMNARLSSGLNSGNVKVEDRLEATIADAVVASGLSVIPAGSVLRGIVSSVEPATRTNRTARMTLAFDQVSIQGRRYAIRGSVQIQGSGIKGETKRIATGAGIGAIIGGILGGAKGAGAGAAIGGGGTVAATEGNEINLAAGTILRVRLDSPVVVP